MNVKKRFLNVAASVALALFVLALSLLLLNVGNAPQAQAAPFQADPPQPKYVVFNTAGFTDATKTSGYFLHEEYNVVEIVYSLDDAGSDQYITMTLQVAPDRQGPWLTQAAYAYTSGDTPVANTMVITYPKLRYSRWVVEHSGTEAVTPVVRSVYKYLPYNPSP